MKNKLESYLSLKDGWDGYNAVAPNKISVSNARKFLEAMSCEPTRIAPSVMGGIAITRRKNHKKVFIEFYNTGKIYVLFSDRISGEMIVLPLECYQFNDFVLEIEDYFRE